MTKAHTTHFLRGWELEDACSPPSLSLLSAQEVSMATLHPGPLQPVWQTHCQLFWPSVHLPLPLHKSGQPSGWRNGENEKEGHEAALGKQGSHAEGEQACRAATGPASQWGPYLLSKESGEAGHACRCKKELGHRCRGIPVTTDLGAGDRAILQVGREFSAHPRQLYQCWPDNQTS